MDPTNYTTQTSVPTSEQNVTNFDTDSFTITDVLYQTVYIVIFLVLCILLLITLLAFIHNKTNLPCCWSTDDAKVGTLLAFALQVWDFLSDVNFTYELSTINGSYFYNLYRLSLTFLILPWLLNIGWLLIQRRRWRKHAIVNRVFLFLF